MNNVISFHFILLFLYKNICSHFNWLNPKINLTELLNTSSTSNKSLVQVIVGSIPLSKISDLSFVDKKNVIDKRDSTKYDQSDSPP